MRSLISVGKAWLNKGLINKRICLKWTQKSAIKNCQPSQTGSPPRPRPPLMPPRPPKSALRVAKDTLIGFPLKSLPIKERQKSKGAEARNKCAHKMLNTRKTVKRL